MRPAGSIRMAEPQHDAIVFMTEPTPEERGRALEAACRAIEHEHRRDTVVTLGLCALFCVGGVLAMAWSVASTDARLARIVFWGALTLSNAGIALTLLEAYRRRMEREGDW